MVRVTGGLTGTLVTHGTAIVDGDVTGTLDLRGSSKALVNGDVRGFPKDITGRGFVGLFVRGRVHSEQVEAPPSGSGAWRLHLANSDLPDGGHGPIEGWSSVTVGGDVWDLLE